MASNGSTNVNTSGESNVGMDYKKKGGSDCISDKNMAEVARRLVGTLESDEAGDVVWSPDPPNNKEKLWVLKSQAGGIVGTIKRYDSPTGEWVDDHTELPEPPEPPATYSMSAVIASANETIVVGHNFGTQNYIYFVTPTSDPLNGGRWYEVDKETNNLTLKFLDSTGVNYRIDVYQTVV